MNAIVGYASFDNIQTLWIKNIENIHIKIQIKAPKQTIGDASTPHFD